MKSIKLIFIIVMLFIIIVLCHFINDSDWLKDVKNQMSEVYSTYSLFLIFLAPFMAIDGLEAGKNDFEVEFKKRLEPSFTSIWLLLLLSIAFIVWWSSYNTAKQCYFLFFLIYIGAAVAAMLVLLILILIRNWLNNIGVYKYLVRTADLTFPFIIVAALIFWSAIGMHYIQADLGNKDGTVSLQTLLITLTVTGFIPFRIIMIVVPPMRIVNVMIGIISFLFFIWRIVCFY